MRLRGQGSALLPIVVVIAGLALCLVPLVENLWSRGRSQEVITSVSSIAEGMDEDAREEILAQARAYNARLGGYSEGELPNESIWPYEDQLVVDGTGAMGWVEIPKAGISLVLYHGDSESVLAQGVGHLESTSLPVGGLSSSCWLEGHSGISGSSLFDAIRVLDAGDVVGIHVLGDVYAYRVTGWEIVDPSDIGPEDTGPDGADALTLVTCTTLPDRWNPRGRTGVNDKRLLVHAVRCEYDPMEFEESREDGASDIEVVVGENGRPLAIAAMVLAASLVALGIRRIRVRFSR